ncbi:type B chloramphenicol O-acetyltransferase [Legionella bononiensis]|uniref:Chloramphenicol acetyltransferase n=1 Tax=Legionella bononiensis TaxID=2793102 RepID=A0ABS1WG38_9GAMM|nr:type B chloramphenicol O-acetyltransferase [Legionella bononiensis]MBL7481764.1 type B chloramphenicol O-acetyltransferase [Legionella bononiensis]MBL7528313.1 type B chloramphenicol O-acetyltransferase [Legionella bononiensis]MBL7562787.1 type B chloramphenicol O-acetyltransferase [Legionella bononiensis]
MINNNYFESPFKGIPLSEQVTNPNIIVGRYSYYSGYYHGHSFDDCARYLLSDETGVDKLIIGSFCSIGSGVSFIMAGNQGHRMEWISTFPFFYTDDEYAQNAIDGFQNAGDTEVGHDVWIGAEAMIMPGIKIGHGALIGARSVVTKNVEPYTLVAGNPAKPIRKRFSEEQIKQLLTIEWWNWPENQLASAMNYLCSTDIDGLFNFWLSNQK